MYSLLSYAGILVVATFAAIVLIFAPLFLLATLLAPFRVPRSPRRVIGTVYGVSVIFGPFIAYLALSYFHVYPPRLFEKPQVITQKKVDAVDQMGQDLIAAFSQPERLTIQQLRDSIEKVRDYTAQATAVNRTQETQIAQLRQTAEEETKKAKEAEDSRKERPVAHISAVGCGQISHHERCQSAVETVFYFRRDSFFSNRSSVGFACGRILGTTRQKERKDNRTGPWRSAEHL